MAINLGKILLSNNDEDQKEDSPARFFKVSQSRINVVIAVFAILFIVIFLRLIYLQIIVAPENAKAAEMSRTIQFKTMPKRGTIYDRNGNVLAYSKEASTIYANPSEIDNTHDVATKLSQILGGSDEYYQDIISDHDKKFVYIKRRVDKEIGDQIDESQITGIYTQEDQKREYPYGQVAGQIIGSVNVDGDGLCGLELYYDDVLRGSTGTTVRQQGMFGMPIPGGTIQDTSVVDGQDIMISVDIEIQQKVEDILTADNQKLNSTSMHALVTDPQTGEIYAAASLPLFNPADINSAKEGATDLKCISSTFEPGSTFKSVAAMSILEYGALTPDDTLYCPSEIRADDFEVSDAHDRDDIIYSFRDIIARSSNVGISLATERLGFDKFNEKIHRYRLNDMTNVDFPGDTSGFLLDFNRWSRIHGYNFSFGQGLSVTPLQTTDFYGAIANNGILITPHFLMRYLQSERDEEYETHDIIDNKNAIPVMTDMLRNVVETGTGKAAKIEGYGVAGKTGTGEVADETGKYYEDKYYISFVGFLSQASVPLTCFVGAEKTKDDVSATETFKNIMTFAIERLKIVARA